MSAAKAGWPLTKRGKVPLEQAWWRLRQLVERGPIALDAGSDYGI